MKKHIRWLLVLSVFILFISIVVGSFSHTRGQSSYLLAEAVVLVNSISPDYPEYTRYIKPYLDHFGIPYSVVDISASPLTSELLDYALIVIGHDKIDTGNVYLTENVQGLISDAVNQGSGLVNFDSELADSSNQPYYQYVQSIFGFDYTQALAAANVSINSAPSMGNYVSAAQPSNAVYTLSNTITPEGVILPQQNSAVLATIGSHPLLVAATYGQGKAIQWTSTAWLEVGVWGFFHGFDDLVWRSLTWAARKPFILQGMPPFVTMRVDDVTGPLWWITTANELGFTPWLGVFMNDIDSTEAAQLSTLTNSNQATVSIHSFNTSSFFYWSSSYKQINQNYIVGTQWHQNNNIPISDYVVPHFYQISTYSFQGLSDWGVKCIGTHMEPGSYYGDPWLKIGPFRKYEDGASNSNLPAIYADLINVIGYPEFDGQFFDLITEPRDIRYDWINYTDLDSSINLATNLVKRGLDSMVVATLFTHEYNITPITNERWRAVLQGLTNNIADYNPIYVDMDYACNYARAVYSSSISNSHYDPTSQSLETTLVGSSDMPTVFYLFSEVDGGIESTFVDVPAFTGNVTVTYFLEQPAPTATFTPGPSPTTTDAPTVTNTSLPTTTPTPSSTPTSTSTPTATFTPSNTPTTTNTTTMTSTPTNTSIPTVTPTATDTLTPTNTPPAELIFADGFESGNLSAWSVRRTGGEDLSVSSSAAMEGSFGLQAFIDSKNAIYVQDSSPNSETHYRASFYFAPNSLSMTDGQSFVLVSGAGVSDAFQLKLSFISNAYRLIILAVDDAGVWHSDELGINNSPNFIEIDWKAASSDGANDGLVVLRINGGQQIIISGLNNDTSRIDSIRLGAIAGIKNNTFGTLYFDDFQSYR